MMGKLIRALILFFVFILVLLGLQFLFLYKGSNQGAVLKINDAEINVEIADSPATRVKGLSGRDRLAENSGMLFVFDKPQMPSFWMKDMNFGLDFIWIDEEMKVVYINNNVLPQSYPATFKPPQAVKYMLEVNAGFVESHNIKAGDKVVLTE